MKIATILPTAHLYLDRGSDYFLCLAHHMMKDLDYSLFFRERSQEGGFVIMDNGAAERGSSMPIETLLVMAKSVRCHEIVLPDTIMNASSTLRDSREAIDYVRASGVNIRLMAVPQGSSHIEWLSCLKEMLTWEIDTIGITKFLVPSVYESRVNALNDAPELLGSHKDIHILGCPTDPVELADIEATFPGRIRGTDSSIATIYAQCKMRFEDGPRPDIALDLSSILDEELLQHNIRIWKERCNAD